MAAGDGKIRIVFRGVRGSYVVPGRETVEYGGNTSCHEIHAGGRLIVFDAGNGIINLGHDLMASGAEPTMALFLTHNHHDHTSGLLYFKPAYSKKTTIHFFGPEADPGTIMDALEQLSAPAVHPVQLSRMGMRYTVNIVEDGDVVRWAPGAERPELAPPGYTPSPEDVVVRVHKNSLHPLSGVLNFRIEYAGKSYVYATDVEGDEEKGDPGLAEFARGADLLAHDGQYTSEEYHALRRGWGHSTVRMAVKTAALAGAKRLAIIHFEPTYNDTKLAAMETEAKSAYPGLFFAKEGQVVEI